MIVIAPYQVADLANASEGGQRTKRASLRGALRPIALPISNMRR